MRDDDIVSNKSNNRTFQEVVDARDVATRLSWERSCDSSGPFFRRR